MQGPVSWQALLLLVGALWFVGAFVALIVWQLCRIIQQIHERLIRLEAERRKKEE